MLTHTNVASLSTSRADLLAPAVTAFLTEADLVPTTHRVYALILRS